MAGQMRRSAASDWDRQLRYDGSGGITGLGELITCSGSTERLCPAVFAKWHIPFIAVSVMADRDMTPDELERFEHEVIHHEIEDSGPASEPDAQDQPQPERPVGIPVIPPNPD
jgi:hypothetical protein